MHVAGTDITVKNAVLVTGDICSTDYVNAELEVTKAITQAVKDLRCSNAQIIV